MNSLITVDKDGSIPLPENLSAKKIVLVGGCFDILHQGHLQFLQEAKKKGDYLIALLESDAAIQQAKGVNRPVNSQIARAQSLIDSTCVDTVLILPFPFSNDDYDQLVTSLKPAIIATTEGDPYRHHKERQANHVGAEVVDVINRLPNFSTTDIINTQNL